MTHNLNYYSRYSRAKKKKNIQSLHQYFYESAPTSLENTFSDFNSQDDGFHHNISVNPFMEYQENPLIKVQDQAFQNNQLEVAYSEEDQHQKKKKSLSQINQLSENCQEQQKLQSSQMIDDEPSSLGYEFCVINCQSKSQANQSVRTHSNKRKSSYKQQKGQFLDIDYKPYGNDGSSGQPDSFEDCSFVRIIDNHLNAQQMSTININFSTYKPPVNLTQSYTEQEQKEQKQPTFKQQIQKKKFEPRLVTSTIEGQNSKRSRVNFKNLIRTQNQMKKGAESSTVSGQQKKPQQQIDIKQQRKKLLLAFFQQN